jgi:hypothetical protein
MRVQFDFVASLVNVDQMIEKKEGHYQYMYGAMELVVLVHVDDFYIRKIKQRDNIKTLNRYLTYVYG